MSRRIQRNPHNPRGALWDAPGSCSLLRLLGARGIRLSWSALRGKGKEPWPESQGGLRVKYVEGERNRSNAALGPILCAALGSSSSLEPRSRTCWATCCCVEGIFHEVEAAGGVSRQRQASSVAVTCLLQHRLTAGASLCRVRTRARHLVSRSAPAD
jgi:hypothetical protein